jgi:large subunit ribosomal protein L22
MTKVTAQLNGLRISPRKVRLLAALIRGKRATDALDQLAFFAKRSSPQLAKLVQSAIANAEHNYKLNRDALVIVSMSVDEGVKLKRYRPKGFGRAAPIHKKTSRVNLVLEDRPAAAPKAKRTTTK